MLGSKESLSGINYGFDPEPDHQGVFRRREPEPEPEIEDPNIKKPTGKKTFEKSKKRARDIADLGKKKPKSG